MARMTVYCDVCDQAVVQKGGRGRAKIRHPACAGLQKSIRVIERHIKRLAPSEPGERLWYQLVTLAAEIPRKRDSKGRFVGRKLR